MAEDGSGPGIDDVADVRFRDGLMITFLECRTCGRAWTRTG
jgi:hypothetical protein